MLAVVLLVDVCGIKLLLADDVAAVYRSRTCNFINYLYIYLPYRILLFLEIAVSRIAVLVSPYRYRRIGAT